MENRVKFKSGDQKKFIKHVVKISGLSTVELAQIANVHPRSFRDWKREKLNMSLSTVEIFLKMFKVSLPEKKEDLVKKWIEARRNRNRKGGLVRFAKYGSPGTEEGRRKGGIKSMYNLRKNGNIPKVKIYKTPVYSSELAEFVGIMLGDGGITSSQCTVTLNREVDAEYVRFVTGLGLKLFGESPKFLERKDSKAIVLYYNGVFLIKYLLSIGLKAGNKVKQQVEVPDWVLLLSEYKKTCLRGLMDTDGGVFNHRYTVNGKNYIYKKISFSNRSTPLLHFVFNTLAELGFNPKIIDKVENKKVWLYNGTEVKRYLSQVGSNNQRLLRHLGG
jgi:hypothetical protein